jgi:hypothetical protein
VKWDLDGDRVKLTDLSAELFGGTITGSADVPLDTTKAGKFAVHFKDLDAGLATKTVPDLPVRVTGRVSGKFSADVPAARPGQARAVNADVDLTAPKLTVQGIPAERLTGKVNIAEGVGEYQLEGKALGGSFEVKGHYPPRPKPAPPAANRNSMKARDLDLRHLAAVYKVESLRQLQGRVDLDVSFVDDLSNGTGRLAIRRLGWGDQQLASSLTGSIAVKDGLLTIPDFGGEFAGGILRGRGHLTMSSPARNFVSLTLDRADAKLLFAPVPGLADAATGDVSVVFRGRLGAETRGSGQVSFDRGTLLGSNVTDLRIPFDLTAGTGGGGQLTVRDAALNLGEGRLVGEVTYAWNVTSRLTGQLRFTRVRVKSLIGGESSLFGNGRVTGRFDLSGTNVRTANDVGGTLTATLNQTSVREIPIFTLLTPYLSTSGATGPFQAGEVRGRLGNGVFRLDRLALSSATARLFAEGTVTLAGRLDMDVVAATGQIGFSDRGLRLLGLGLPAVMIGPIPITLIRDVSDYLSNQTIRLRVTGSVKQPSVQVNVAALLSEEAVRFFLNLYLPGAAALVPAADPLNR